MVIEGGDFCRACLDRFRRCNMYPKGRGQQVQDALNEMWPCESAEIREFLFFIDAVLSTDDPKKEFLRAMDRIWPMASEQDLEYIARVLFLTFF